MKAGTRTSQSLPEGLRYEERPTMGRDGRRRPSMARGKELQGEGCQEVNAMTIRSLQDNEEDIPCGVSIESPAINEDSRHVPHRPSIPL
jgi:hypothetical protein